MVRGHEGPGHRRPWGDSVSPAGQHGQKGESWWATAPRAAPPLGQERSGSVLLGCGLSVTEQSFSRLYLTRRPALKAPEGRVRRLRKWGRGCAPAWLSLHGFPPRLPSAPAHPSKVPGSLACPQPSMHPFTRSIQRTLKMPPAGSSSAWTPFLPPPKQQKYCIAWH